MFNSNLYFPSDSLIKTCLYKGLGSSCIKKSCFYRLQDGWLKKFIKRIRNLNKSFMLHCKNVCPWLIIRNCHCHPMYINFFSTDYCSNMQSYILFIKRFEKSFANSSIILSLVLHFFTRLSVSSKPFCRCCSILSATTAKLCCFEQVSTLYWLLHFLY